MLVELSERPRTTEELSLAADSYGLNWHRGDQIARRRRWLQSAKLIEPAGSGRIAITNEGRNLLANLTPHQPDISNKDAEQRPPKVLPAFQQDNKKSIPPASAPGSELPALPNVSTPAEALAAEIRAASTDSKNPDRLEIAVRDAYQFLGFDTEQLGGSGKTDVLVKALLGKDDSYSVTIDAKTVGAGSLGDRQVDWVTLDEHKRQHNADYSMLVGPNPSGKRLMNRAVDQSVAVLSTGQLADLCIQHADAPLGLQDYRTLFETGGAVDTAPIDKAAHDLARLRELSCWQRWLIKPVTLAHSPLAISGSS